MSKKINYESMLAALRAAVEERGENYVYPQRGEQDNCFYVWEDKPDCIAGTALHSLGMSLDSLRLNEGIAVDGIAIRINGEVASMTEKASFLVRRVQQFQDKGRSWGEALAEGLDYIGRFNFSSEEYYKGVK